LVRIRAFTVIKLTCLFFFHRVLVIFTEILRLIILHIFLFEFFIRENRLLIIDQSLSIIGKHSRIHFLFIFFNESLNKITIENFHFIDGKISIIHHMNHLIGTEGSSFPIPIEFDLVSVRFLCHWLNQHITSFFLENQRLMI
jgi:hypothetical protein